MFHSEHASVKGTKDGQDFRKVAQALLKACLSPFKSGFLASKLGDNPR